MTAVESLLTLVRLADEYRMACENVQIEWKKLLASPVRSENGVPAYDSFKSRGGPYLEAMKKAKAARDVLLTHASGGVMEVGT